jgi:hypothetical protein
MYNFTLRIYNPETRNCYLTDINNITISDITIISKPSKYSDICTHNGNKKKYKYDFTLSKKFLYGAGSHSSPILAFKGDYIDIHITNFPRYPAFYQDKHEARNIMNGYNSFQNNGFPIQLKYLKIEVLNLKKQLNK